jgi:hypothetical protein
VSKCYRTRARAGCERGQREMEWQPAWVLPLVEFAKKGEEKNKKRTKFGEFGRYSNEFEKCKVLVQKVVMIGSEMFLSG